MRIYKFEQKDNLEDKINDTGNSLSFVSAQVSVGDIIQGLTNISVADFLKTASTVQTVEELLGQEHPDLALVVAILVSTGWNLNDDIFTPLEVWKAKDTPLHKPINDNHVAERILGHIVQTRVLNKDGSEIVCDDIQALPYDFDIEVAGVLYRAFPQLAERINEIITKAQAGKIFVSMEAWFPDFCYGIKNLSTGETKVIDRNETTAFLTKHLRVYGGTGEYHGYKIGRVLKDIVFGAQGFVDTPANPESVIKVAASRNFVTAELSDLLEGGAEIVDEQELNELKASLDLKTKELVDLQGVVEAMKAKDYEGQLATLSDQVKAMEAEKSELQKQLVDVTKRAETSEAELVGIRKTEIARQRLVQLTAVKKVEDETSALAELREMTDETFAVVLKYAGDSVKLPETPIVKDENVKEEQAEAALNCVEEEDTADFSVTDTTTRSDADRWVSFATALCGREIKEEGGE